MLSNEARPAGPGVPPDPAGTPPPPGPPEHWAELAAGDDLGLDVSTWMRMRRVIVGTLLTVFILAPTVAVVAYQGFAAWGRGASPWPP